MESIEPFSRARRAWAGSRCPGVIAALALLWIAGCPPAPTRSLVERAAIEAGGGTLIPPEAGERSYQPSDTWDPRHGRMGSYLQQRHVAPAESQADAQAHRELFTERFSPFDPASPSPWERLGDPRLSIAVTPNGKVLEMACPVSPGPHGLQRALDVAAIRGAPIRIRVRARLASAALVRHLGAPQVRLATQSDRGAESVNALPFVGRASPGWETQEFTAWIAPSVRRAWLQIVYEQSGAPCELAEVAVARVGWGGYRWTGTRSGGEPAMPPAEPGADAWPWNLVPNGSFEVGPKGFAVSAERTWPGRGTYTSPQPWHLDSDAAVGAVSLCIPAAGAVPRVVLGPIDLGPGASRGRATPRYHLSFHAKASTPTDLSITWRIAGVAAPTHGLHVGTEWARHRHIFLTPTELLRTARTLPATSELVFVGARVANGDPVTLWLDGVSLSEERVSNPYLPASPVEVGLLGPAPDPTDVGEVVPIGQPVGLTVRIANYQTSLYTGGVAVDLVDASDRPVWTKTLRPLVEPDHVRDEQIVLTLPRGYYRAIASAWADGIGTSALLSRHEVAMAVLDLSDPVPRDGFFGLQADAGALSARTAQFGVGWVLMPIDLRWRGYAPSIGAAARSLWSGWLDATTHCGSQDLDVVARLVHGPDAADDARAAYRAWLDEGGAHVVAVCVDRSTTGAPGRGEFAAARRTLGGPTIPPPAVVLKLAGDHIPALPASQPTTVSASAPTTAPGQTPDGFAFDADGDYVLPEDAEPMLQRWGQFGRSLGRASWWDLAVPGEAASAYAHHAAIAGNERALVVIPRPEVDPVLSASRLVRAMLIRHLAGAGFACGTVHAFRPYGTLLGEPDDRFNEYNHAPRPALAAWDWMTAMLNNATPIRWYDKAGDVRAAAFERASGGVVVVLWRPFGRSEHELTLTGLAGQARVYDLFGRPEAGPARRADLVVRVNELVRYVVADAEGRDALLAALASAEPSSSASR